MKKMKLTEKYSSRITVKLSTEQVLRLNKICSNKGISYSKFFRDTLDSIKEIDKDVVIC